MENNFVLDFAGRKMTLETGRYAQQANGSVLVRYGESTVLVTATMSEPREGIDYFPLMVNYEERIYAIGKIPGSINRREGKPRDRATLAARLIDRPLRPLFPDGFRHDVQVIATVLSVDGDNEPDIMALNGASIALTISDIPFAGPIGAVKVGLVDGELIINPVEEQRERSLLDLTVAASKDGVLMVEAGAEEVDEETMIEAIEFAHEEIKKSVAMQEEMRERLGKEKMEFPQPEVDEELKAEIFNSYEDEMKQAVYTRDKGEREDLIDAVKYKIISDYQERFAELEGEIASDKMGQVRDIAHKLLKHTVRKGILTENRRPDGRSSDEIRPIWSEVQVLPRAHGSAVFTRGQTQVMSVATLGAVSDEQILFGLGEDETKRYLHHYNFPPYSVGETGPLRAPGRREIGHGALAERALFPVIPAQEDFPYTLRIVSEVLESNGSTSQASVCGSTMALMDAGVPIKAPVAGIAMGLMKEGENYVVLSDIQGMEDFNGDMDFKVAGTEKGITALQMDIKISGVSKEILRVALAQAREGRLHILNKMLEVLPEPRPELSPYAPSMIRLTIDPEKISDVIGPGGKVIKKIIEQTGVQIDIEDDGTVYILADDQESGKMAVKLVEERTKDVEPGEIYEGTVKRVVNFGAFVEVLPGKEGLVHISKIANHHVKKVEDEMQVGDKVMVKVSNIDNQGRINLSMKDVEQPAKDNDKDE
ncbi:MAG: polyribonucleotide nucleotidyltransferase [Halanaerobium sp.]|nr:polyribonucleotide nucleotidyltransferase [Halanaerobium sp.]